MKLYLKQRLAWFLFSCALHLDHEKGKTARMLSTAGKGGWKVCKLCHALCLCDAFEGKYAHRSLTSG
jgi:hypothetical protein